MWSLYQVSKLLFQIENMIHWSMNSLQINLSGMFEDQGQRIDDDSKSLRDKMLKDPHDDGISVFKNFEVKILCFSTISNLDISLESFLK